MNQTTPKNILLVAMAGALMGTFLSKASSKRKAIIMLGIAVVALVIYYGFLKSNPESSWKPIYRDPKKEMIAMRGMANESNSVAGMIGNPVIGAMKHKHTLA